MATNSYLPFAIAAGANVWSDAAYNGSQQQQTGQQKGIVPSGMMNKAWRQGTIGTAVLGQIVVDHGLIDAPDDGNFSGLKANVRMALAAMLAGVAFGVDQSSTANVVAVTLDPAPPSLTTFREIIVRIANTNTGAVALSLNNLGTKGVVKKGGAALLAGDLPASQFARLFYDATAGQWVVAGFAASDVLALAQSVLSSRLITGRVPFRYPSPGTFTLAVSAGTAFEITECRGAGGGGGGSSSNSYAGAGGGGGGRASKIATAVSDTILLIAVGAGGTAGSAGGGNGGTGGTTSITIQSGSVRDANGVIFTTGQTLCAATGGSGGQGAAGAFPTGMGTPGGTASGGDLNDNGNIGNYSLGGNPGQLQGGLGGSSPGSAPPGPNVNDVGKTSTDPGSGGSGASTNADGGKGSDGRTTIYK
jgi:hypothetical protein